MNALPASWIAELKDAYPRKSGPMGWGSVRLMLELRRALQTSTWGQVLDGCKRYKAYAQASGKEGSDYIRSPLSFIADGCYLEEFEYAQAEDPKIVEARRREQERSERASARGDHLGIARHPLESVGAYETRLNLAESTGSASGDANHRPSTTAIPIQGHDNLGQKPNCVNANQLRANITELSARLRSIR